MVFTSGVPGIDLAPVKCRKRRRLNSNLLSKI